MLATLRYGVNVHGSVPTAMEFFRWRLAGAPATPTQATVYRLFPGGWSAVLQALCNSFPVEARGEGVDRGDARGLGGKVALEPFGEVVGDRGDDGDARR